MSEQVPRRGGPRKQAIKWTVVLVCVFGLSALAMTLADAFGIKFLPTMDLDM